MSNKDLDKKSYQLITEINQIALNSHANHLSWRGTSKILLNLLLNHHSAINENVIEILKSDSVLQQALSSNNPLRTLAFQALENNLFICYAYL